MALITHGECGKSWTGRARAHCSGCHETFSTYGASDKHRHGPFPRTCGDPATGGLVRRWDAQGNVYWGYPSDPRYAV